MKPFDAYPISEVIQQAIAKLGYHQPTDVQTAVLDDMLNGIDLIVQSKTGSGKTAAFGIPVCERVDWEENRPQALIITPTRELAEQVKNDLLLIGRFKRLQVLAVYGKQSFEAQKLALKQKCHILVGTPGRLLDHLTKGTLDPSSIQMVIIDEADELFQLGFIDQVNGIMEKLPKQRSRYLFSATMPAAVSELASTHLRNPKRIQFTVQEQLPNPIVHVQVNVEAEEKQETFMRLLQQDPPDRAIIFCNTQEQVNRLHRALERQSVRVLKIHGGMIQEHRTAVMRSFRRGESRLLVATDLAARGIDVDHLTHVYHYDWPLDTERYVHRCGRTGRAGNSGQSIALVTSFERHKAAETAIQLQFEFVEKPLTASDIRPLAEPLNRPLETTDKSTQVNQTIMRLFFNGGKRKKLRAVDFVGSITSIEGIHSGDIGVITIQENETFVDILNGKGQHVLQEMKEKLIKGKKLKVYPAFEQF